MSCVTLFKKMFAGADLEIDDLFLLESFQIAYFPGWIPERELAVVLVARPEIKRFLITRCPEISGFVDSVLQKHTEDEDPSEVDSCCHAVVWTIADLLVYNKCPERYDRLPFLRWSFSEVTSIVDLNGKTVIDGGSGTGRVALEAAESAAVVFAVEPVSRLRGFIREQVGRRGLTNVHVVDGFLHMLPFPDAFADVVITSHALGWKLQEELREFERVVKRRGSIIHCPGTSASCGDETHRALIESPHSYDFAECCEADGRKRKYWKQVG